MRRNEVYWILLTVALAGCAAALLVVSVVALSEGAWVTGVSSLLTCALCGVLVDVMARARKEVFE